jgi:hypothetical protein
MKYGQDPRFGWISRHWTQRGNGVVGSSSLCWVELRLPCVLTVGALHECDVIAT